MDCHFSDLLRLLKNGQKSDSFSTHFEQHFKSTTSRIDLRKFTALQVVKQLNLIGVMKIFTKPNCKLCMEERLTIIKKLRDKLIMVMNKNLDIYRACQHRITSHQYFLRTDDPV